MSADPMDTTYPRLIDEIENLREALRAVVSDILEYEHLNNLAPNPGRKYCWDSVARAQEILEPDSHD